MKSHSDADAAVLRRSIGKQTAACFIALILQAKRRLCGGCAAAVCGGLQNVNDINVRRSCAGAAAVLPHTPYRRFTPPIGSARRLSEGKTVTANRAKPHRQREASAPQCVARMVRPGDAARRDAIGRIFRCAHRAVVRQGPPRTGWRAASRCRKLWRERLDVRASDTTSGAICC